MEKINQSFGLALIGFNESQKETFSAILSLAERRLQHIWDVVDISRADFFLLSIEKSQSEAFIVEKKLPRQRCIFCARQRLAEYDDDVLFFPSGQVPQLSSVVAVLNQVANTASCAQILTDSHSIPPITEPPKTIVLNNDDDFFNPERGFFKHLLQNKTDRQVYHFNYPTSSYDLYVDPVEKVYYSKASLKKLDSCLLTEDVIVINDISQAEWIREVVDAALATRPLSNLIWYIAFRLSNGRLLRGHSNQDCVYLTRWPDLGVEGCGQYVKLAAFMRNNAVCLTAVADKTSTPLPAVYNFYNACYLVGLVEKSVTEELYTKNIAEDKQVLLAKITNRLKKINSEKVKVD
jgi:hypothetical protein